MPLPKPRPQEKEPDFVSRCAGDPVMNREFPKQKNKLAVCYSLYSQYKKKHGAAASWEDYKKEYFINNILLLP
jgi:hypothetical protein